MTLVAAVERDMNEDELGEIVRYGIEHPAVRSVAFQPVTHSGRHVEFDPLTRLTNSDIIHLIAEQLPEWFRPSDFFPVPCCFPTCRSITYLIVDRDEQGELTVVPIPRLVQIEDYLDYVSNRVMPDEGVREALEKLWSASAFIGTETTQGVHDRHPGLPGPYTLNVKQLMKCCVEEITPDGRLIPFCAYNSVGYREQVREQMSGVTIADVVPNATPLQQVLAPSKYGSKVARDGHQNGERIAPDSTNVGKGIR